jgi:hypothetical protein
LEFICNCSLGTSCGSKRRTPEVAEKYHETGLIQAFAPAAPPLQGTVVLRRGRLARGWKRETFERHGTGIWHGRTESGRDKLNTEVVVRRTIIGLAAMLMLSVATSAQAVTIRDIIDLTQAGLGDQVLLALIEVDGGVFDIDADTLATLQRAGVSEAVIVALVRSGRVRQPEQVPDQTATMSSERASPQIVVVQSPPSVVHDTVEVPVPVYVGVPVVVHQRQGHARSAATSAPQGLPQLTSPLASRPYLTDTPPQPTPAQPVYWGWGGKLRPDAWQPR